MPAVVISFADGEVMHAEMPEITFDLAVLEAELRSVDPNSERALFSVAAIRQLIVGDPLPAPPPDVVAGWDRAAFHFADGEVLRASIAPDALLGRHGGVWHIVEPESTELRTVAIPYAALKGVYRIRQWDSRSMTDRQDEEQLDRLARILAEREAHEAGTDAPHHRALLSRMRRPPDPGQATEP
jgi:hypothetical protein